VLGLTLGLCLVLGLDFTLVFGLGLGIKIRFVHGENNEKAY